MSRGPAVLTPSYYERLDVLEQRHWWCRSVRRVALALIDRLGSDAGVALDAGCGTGGFLVALGERRSALYGIGADLSLDALGRARGHGVRRLIDASVVELPVASGEIDLVVSNDVLQHLPAGEDGRAVAETYRVLKPGGFFCLRSNLGSPVESGPTLHRRYDPIGLSRLVHEAGFLILEHIILHPFARLWAALRGQQSGDHPDAHHGLSLALPAAPVNAAIDVYTRLEDAIVRRLPFRLSQGDAQIVLAQKPHRA
jgi:SAM-dependent methyltransferase